MNITRKLRNLAVMLVMAAAIAAAGCVIGTNALRVLQSHSDHITALSHADM